MGVTRRETDIEVGSMIFDIWLSTLLCKNSQKSIESYLKTMKRIDKEVGCCKSLANGDKIKTRCFSLSSDHADDLEKSDNSTEGKSDGTTDLGTSALVSGGAGSGLGSRGLAGSPRGSKGGAGRTDNDTVRARGCGGARGNNGT
jgi:hypothetical protein